MADQNAIYISSISGAKPGGKCIENTQREKGECRLRKWNKTAGQQWIVEPSNEGPNIVAFKSVADQQYLAALQPEKRNGGKIGVQAWKQLWTLESAEGPGWFHIKSNSSFGGGKAGYLNDEWGRWENDNKIQTYQYEPNRPSFNTFYFSAATVVDTETPNFSSASGDGQAGREEDLDAREKSLQDREAAIEKNKKDQEGKGKGLEEKEAVLAKREEELAQKEKDSNAAGTALQNDGAEQSKALEEKEAELAKKEAALAKREEELASKEKDGKPAGAPPQSDGAEQSKALEEKEAELAKKEAALAKREEELAQKEKDGNAAGTALQNDGAEQSKALEEKEAELAKKEKDLQRREQELASASAQGNSMPAKEVSIPSQSKDNATKDSSKSSEADVHELCRLLRENDTLKLKVRIGVLEAQLRERACTHKIKRPPRKIECKVEGYVYS